MHLSEREVLIGKFKHAAYKPCYWTAQSLRTGGRRQCYKHHFGIKSHLCIQSTSFRGCNIACSFCWRDVEGRQHSFQKIDEPSDIADELVAQQSYIVEQSLPDALENYENMIRLARLLSHGPATISELAERCEISRQRTEDALIDMKNAGVVSQPPGKSKVFALNSNLCSEEFLDKDAVELIEGHVASRKEIIDVHLEASKPRHVAISYDGEPTMYVRLPELISEFRKRGISTFVVTNGTFPERITEMAETGNLPTQLYVTLAAPDRETYLRVCSSVSPKFLAREEHWNRLNQTLGMLSALTCRTVIRITSVRGVNMVKPELYKKKILEANPNFLEIKGFSISGNAPRISERLGETNLGPTDPSLLKSALKYAPTHDEIMDFARTISGDFSVFPMISESKLNRQVLMRVSWRTENVLIDFANA
jgi:wyosine [tRNA(Phe)-imidazoG37] synthetase (radical SAM superfamily)